MYALRTELKLPVDTDWNKFRQEVAPRAKLYQNVPGLRSKAFVLSPERGLYGGHYVFETREALNDFLSSELFQAARDKFGPGFQTHVYEVVAYLDQGNIFT
jgi:hypothetical protein